LSGAGKYRDNELITSLPSDKSTSGMFAIRTKRLRQRIDSAVVEANRAAEVALQKTDIAAARCAPPISRHNLDLSFLESRARKPLQEFISSSLFHKLLLQCCDTVDESTGRASDLKKIMLQQSPEVSFGGH